MKMAKHSECFLNRCSPLFKPFLACPVTQRAEARTKKAWAQLEELKLGSGSIISCGHILLLLSRPKIKSFGAKKVQMARICRRDAETIKLELFIWAVNHSRCVVRF